MCSSGWTRGVDTSCADPAYTSAMPITSAASARIGRRSEAMRPPMLDVIGDEPCGMGAIVMPRMAVRRALVIGIAGQDGSLLSELLLAEGYEVFGVVRQPVSSRFPNLDPIRNEIELLQADVLDELSLV